MTNKEMLINVSTGEECRIALLEDGRLEELYMERSSSTSHVGNIYKGRVTNVEASIQAAFVDFGLGRNGFLHISDLMPTYFGRKGEEIQESVGRKMSRRDRPPIQRCLRRGDEIIVQIIKEGIGTKGPTLSTYLSIPGRILVMMPGMGKFGVSRKIEDEDERRRLRAILDSLKPLKDVGFIIRTAGIGKSKTDIQRDLTYLTRLWQTIEKKLKSGPAPMELYTEGDLVTRTVRDVFTTDIGRIIVDNKEVARRVKEVIKLSNPRTKNKVELFDEPIPLFHKYGIEREIELMYSRHVPLPSGGSLVIDSTEAIVAIDVNSGKFRDHADAETTAFKTDMEAADEIPRQLRLRDLGGVIICDFIDLRYERHRRDLEKRLHDNLRNDRAKTKVLRMSQFGIIEMTRQRMRPSLKRSIYFDCPHCKGSGLVKTPESMSLDVMRRLAIAVNDQRVARIELVVCPDVAFYLLNKKRQQMVVLEDDSKKSILVRQDPKLALDDVNLVLFDGRDGLVYIDELGMSPAAQGEEQGRRHHAPAHGRRDAHKRGGAPQGRVRGQERPREPERHREIEEDRFDMDREAGPERADEDNEAREAAHASAPDALEADESTSDAADEPRDKKPPRRDTPRDTRRGRGRAPRAADEDIDADSDAPTQVVDVDDPTEPMGEGPRAFEEERGANDNRRPGRRRRGRRGRGGRGRGQQAPGQQQSAGPRDSDDDARDDQPRERVEQSGNVIPAEPGLDDEDVPGPGNEAPRGEGDAAEGDQPPKRRRRRRGGRRHRRRKNGVENTNGQPPAIAGAPRDEEPSDESDNLARDDDENEDAAGNEASGDSDEPPVRPPSRRPPTRVPPPRQSPRSAAAAPPPPVVKTGSTDRHLVDDDVIEEPIETPEPSRRVRGYADLDAIPDDFED